MLLNIKIAQKKCWIRLLERSESRILLEKFPSEHKTELTRTDKKGTKKEGLRWQVLVMVREDKIEKSGPDFFSKERLGGDPKS